MKSRKAVEQTELKFSELSIECRRCGATPYTLEMYGNRSNEEKKKALAEVWNRRT